MSSNNGNTPGRFGALRRYFGEVPLLGWLAGALAAVLAEQFVGLDLAHLVELPRIPVLFGFENALKKPELIPGTLLYILVIYFAPTLVVGRLLQLPSNRVAGFWPGAGPPRPSSSTWRCSMRSCTSGRTSTTTA